MEKQWYVLRSLPNKELTLWRELSARRFDCCCPHLRVKPVNPRSRKVRPYFPGYLFLHVDVDEVGASTFQWMPFSNGFVAFGDVLASVPDNLIQAIRRHVDEINAAGPCGEPAGLKRGDVVVIEGGAFEGYKAIFDARLPGRDRVRVLMKLLQARQVTIELPTSQIRRLCTPFSRADSW